MYLSNYYQSIKCVRRFIDNTSKMYMLHTAIAFCKWNKHPFRYPNNYNQCIWAQCDISTDSLRSMMIFLSSLDKLESLMRKNIVVVMLVVIALSTSIDLQPIYGRRKSFKWVQYVWTTYFLFEMKNIRFQSFLKFNEPQRSKCGEKAYAHSNDCC